MERISQDWEVMDRRVDLSLDVTVFMLFLLLLDLEPGFYPSTWTVRRKSTGIVKRVTAGSEAEAADRIAREYFDAD